jgi:hypothetical protein
LVAGLPRNGEEDREECSEDAFSWFGPQHRSGAAVRLGSGRPSPAGPVTRKGPSNPDVVFYPDPSTGRGLGARLSVLGNTVMVRHPCWDRLFRPPRLA